MREKSRVKIRTPAGVVYFIVYIFVYPFLKIWFRMKVDRRSYRPVKGPFILLSNHQSFMDFIAVMLAAYPRRINAVAAQKFFYYRPLDRFLPYMGCIPKNLFEADTRAIMGIMSVIKRGGRVLIFPEARCSTDGVYAGMDKSTGKLIKRIGVPVVSCHIGGSYNSMPLWRKGFRSGRVRLMFSNLFSAEDLKDLEPDEINRRIDNRLSGLDSPPPEKPFTVFRSGGLAEGLENILYYCPKCEREFTLETKGSAVYCTACGHTAIMDRTGTLVPEGGGKAMTVHDWFREQVRYEQRRLSRDPQPEKVTVTVRMPKKGESGLHHCGRGEMSLDGEGWCYTGELSGENVQLFFPLQTVPAIPFDPNDNFQIYSGGNFYAFTPENPRACVKYAILGECAYRFYVSPVQMTNGYDSGFYTTV